MRAALRCEVPYCPDGLRIGLFGGSFDPPHSGHCHATRWAMKQIALDRVWWLFSTGNPLKSRRPADVADRIVAAGSVIHHPRVHFSDLEARAGLHHTFETLDLLQSLNPNARFVWLMGSDSLASFHLWAEWQEIFGRVCIGVLARHPHQFAVVNSVAARAFASCRIPDRSSRFLAEFDPPAWAMFRMPLDFTSSSKLRMSGS